MSVTMVDGVWTLHIDHIMTLAWAAIILLLGYFVTNRSQFLQRFVIPAPVVGGFIFMMITWMGHLTGTFQIEFDNLYQSLFMLFFFTTIGMGASMTLVKTGGRLLVIYWGLSALLSIIQNVVGISVAKFINLEPAYALLASAASLVGGHGAALSYGTTFESMGYDGAVLVGAACATFGLISAVLLGGPLGKRMIEKNNLKADERESDRLKLEAADRLLNEEHTLNSLDIFKNVAALLFSMAIGVEIAKWIGIQIDMTFPDYVGAMFVAVIVRNLNDRFHLFKLDMRLIDEIGTVMLNLYLSLALMTLKLWELGNIFGGVAIVLVIQLIVTVAYVYFVVFPMLGKDYDAAVMSAGELGHGLGATSTAMVNMNALNERYGTSYRALMIVPIVGSFLVDIIYQPQTIWFIKTFVETK